MAWIESNQELGRHPKTKKLARLLEISVVTAVGHLHYLWWWALDFAQEGILDRYDEYDISEACMWEGDKKLFVDSLIQSGFIDQKESTLCIHDWYEYAGILIERRKSDAERKRLDRDKKKKASNKSSKKKTSIGHPPDVREKSADVQRNRTLPYPTVPNPTVPYQTNIDTVVVDSAHEEILAGLSEMDDSVSVLGDSVSNSDDLATNFGENADDTPDFIVVSKPNAISFAEKNFGRPVKQFECEQLTDWANQLIERGSTDPDAVLIAGMQRCIKQDVFKLSYLEGIMVDWLNHGVTTLDHIASRDEEWNANKERKRKGNAPGNKPPPPPKTPKNKYDKFYL